MYLKRLNLHGFKSFAARTALDFSPGTTAIVGPNGSGKSNIADSLRWVLGEQSMRQLRGKKSEDIIFAGGHGRAQLGMAEVTLTLDNASNWLPSEFTEVTVTRRAFRSGDSDYLINGTKVRLKDMLNLLSQARIGHDSYTIIGQGLVDQALSSRAEERRSLFEDAAGIRHFQTQRNDAEGRLTQTHTNLSRLHDILNEIEPRLGPLAEQARRAREYITTRADLDRAQRQWFAYQWRAVHAKVELAEFAESAAQGRAEGLRAGLGAHESNQQGLRQERAALIEAIAELRRQRGETLSRVQTLERDRAVAQERAASLERQRKELDGEQGRMNWSLVEAETRIQQMEAQVADGEDAITVAQTTIAEMESASHRARQQQERDEAKLRAAQRDAMQAQARLTAAQAEAGRLRKGRDDRQTALAARQSATQAAQERAGAAQTKLDALRQAHEAARAELGDLLVEREALATRIAGDAAQVETLRGALADHQRERRALADRLKLLHEWEASQGSSSAVLAAIEAVPPDDRPRILGTLAQVVRSDPRYEVAFEAALHPYLNALVAASEDDAWRAALLLEAAAVGRALVLWPLEADSPVPPAPLSGSHGSDHTGSDSSRPRRNCANGATNGTHVGNGQRAATAAEPVTLADLLDAQAEPAAASVIRVLLGPLALTAAMGAGELRWQMAARPLVTPTGQMAHPAGWLAVGQGTRDAGDSVLARSRELRELPQAIDAADLTIREREGLLANARAALEDDRGALAGLERDIKHREHALSEASKTLGNAQREAERLSNEAHLADAVTQQIAAELLTLEDDLAAVVARITEADAAQRDTAELLETLQDDVAAALEAARAQADDLAKRRTALAVRQQEAKALQSQIATAHAQLRDLTGQVERRAGRLAELEAEASALIAALAASATELEAQRVILRDLSGKLGAREAEAAGIEQQLGGIEAAQAAGRVELTQAEEQLRKALLEAQRARDAIEALRVQVAEEMSEDDARAIIERVYELAPEDQTPSPEEMTKMRRGIDQLRGRMKSLGGYDPEAPQAYEELKTRYEFLTAQVHDMEDASARLRAVIMELDATMKRRFDETFQAVNERFRQHFVTLFQGGNARLEMQQPKRGAKGEADDEDEELAEALPAKKNNIAGGVEIFVQIPGKKVQDLSLLSGGERSLVSSALLFALLETNPPPFCLLDEVDAALDESNVVRFCEILLTLAHQTQFIVITHNRVTMTHANVIYGVSMTDSVSRILSMKLAEAQVSAR